MSRLNVFVSSAIEELRNERKKIKQVLRPLGVDVFLFELDAGARSESTRQVYTEEVLSCDIYIGLFKNNFSLPTKEEYELASTNNKEILIYISAKGNEKREPELESLLKIIEAKHTRQKYSTIQKLEYQIKKDVMDVLKRRFKQASKQNVTIDDWLKLLQNKIDLYTLSTEFGDGSKDCWKTGHFRNEDIKSGYDVRRPVTDEIITSVDNDIGTIVYGRPYYGKSVILKRVMIEQISKGYAVLYCNDVGVKSVTTPIDAARMMADCLDAE